MWIGLSFAALCSVGNAFVVQPPPPRAITPSFLRNSKTTTARHLSPPSYEALVEKLPSGKVIEVVEQSPDGKVIAAGRFFIVLMSDTSYAIFSCVISRPHSPHSIPSLSILTPLSLLDVATSAGVSLSQARKDLTALASLSQADIAVSSDGELIFDFPRNLNSVLSQNSAKFKAIQVFRKIWPGLFYVLRVSFGVVLLASLAAIFSTILFLQSSSSSSDDDRRRDNRGYGGGSPFGGGSYFWGPSPLDFFYYRPYYGYYGPRGLERDPEEMGFLESVFSYIFGDGNPNQGLEERRLSLAANMIRANKGSVTAEQLAPFCDDVPLPNDDNQESAYVDEVRLQQVAIDNVDGTSLLPFLTSILRLVSVTEFRIAHCHTAQW